MMNTHARQSKRMLAALLAGVGLSVLVWVAGPGGKPAFAGQGGGGSFAENITGVWLSNPPPAPPFNPVGFQVLTHFHADGTMFWSHNREFGGTGFGPNGAVYCIWEQTGDLELTTTELGFIYKVSGQHDATGRVTTVFTFSEDFQTYTAEGFEELFRAGEMPTDPEVEPYTSFSFDFDGERLNMPE